MILQKSFTWPDVLSSVYHTGPLGPSDSTGTVTEPRIVLFHTMSQSYIVTFIYGIVENKCIRTREMKCTGLPASRKQLSKGTNLSRQWKIILGSHNINL